MKYRKSIARRKADRMGSTRFRRNRGDSGLSPVFFFFAVRFFEPIVHVFMDDHGIYQHRAYSYRLESDDRPQYDQRQRFVYAPAGDYRPGQRCREDSDRQMSAILFHQRSVQLFHFRKLYFLALIVVHPMNFPSIVLLLYDAKKKDPTGMSGLFSERR